MIEMWHGNRDREGWKVSLEELASQAEKPDECLGSSNEDKAQLVYVLRKKKVQLMKTGNAPLAPHLMELREVCLKGWYL